MNADVEARSIAFVLPYGEPVDGFFPDTLAGLLCARARASGHRAEVLRVYYHGRDEREDARMRARLREWLDERDVDLVVLERLFDPAPIRAHLDARAGRTSLLVTRGEPFEPTDAIEWVVGANASPTKRGHRRSPEVGELVESFGAFLERWAAGHDPRDAAGVSHAAPEGLHHGPPSSPAPLPRPVHPVLEQDTLAPGEPPVVRRKTLFGNAGCPYAADPLEAPHFARVRLPIDPAPARLGCAFCSMGGDYQKRPDAQVVEELLEQARWITEGLSGVDELVLSDQHALRYLAALMEAARDLRPLRFLFAARADAFVRERPRIEAAIEAARAGGHRLEVYLSGFEAFSDAVLARYRKGFGVEDSIAAVEAMRSLAASHPDVFDYARARGHSLILFDPWTTPEELGESVATLRRHGLAELFDEVGRNRLRLHDELPITAAARRDGALTEAWEAGDEGAARRKGYPTERPWRFLDARTRRARELAEVLRARLGPNTELAQLAAVVRACDARSEHCIAKDRTDDRVEARVHDRVDDLVEDLEELAAVMASRPGGAHRDAAVVRFAGACNDGCASCPNRDRFLADDAQHVLARVEAARATGAPVVLAGREPTLHPAFLEAVRRARGDDAREVCVVSNGRRFAYAPFTESSIAVGLRFASVKIFAPDAATADRIARVEGAHDQALAGMENLRRAVTTLELRVPLHADNLDALPRYADLAAEIGADALFVEAALDAVGLEALADAARAASELVSACDARGLAVETAPLAAGATRFDRLPTARSRARRSA